jgi:hypothetical protein
VAANGSAQLRLIANHCRDVGERGLLNSTRAVIRAEAEPLKAALRQSALSNLPRGGGLNVQVANQRVTVSALAGARTVGIQLKTTAPDTSSTNDDGQVRHPTFGRRGQGQWKTQSIPKAKGWWDKPCAEVGPPVAAAMLATLVRVAAEISAV